MKIAYVLFPDFTALDLVGPYGARIGRARSALSGRTTNGAKPPSERGNEVALGQPASTSKLKHRSTR